MVLRLRLFAFILPFLFGFHSLHILHVNIVSWDSKSGSLLFLPFISPFFCLFKEYLVIVFLS